MDMRKKFLILLCAVVLIAGCGFGRKTPQEYISQAQNHIDKGQLETAQIELKNALIYSPNNPQARWLLGNLDIKLGNGDSAEKELKQAVTLGVSSTAVQPPLAQALLLQENYQAVLALVPDPGLTPHALAELLATRGMALLSQHKFQEAEQEFTKSLGLDSKSLAAMTGLARLEATKGNLVKAREELKQTFAIDNRYAPAWSLLGGIEVYEGHSEAAEKAFTNAIENQYANAPDILSRLYLRLNANKFDEAKSDINLLKNKLGKSPLVDYAQGLLYLQQKHYTEASSAFEKVLNAKNDYPPALFYAGAAHFMAGNKNQAENYLARFNTLRPNSIPTLKMLAWLDLQKDDFNAAERLIKPVIEQNKDDSFALNVMASALVGQNKTKEGLSYFQKIVVLQPEFAPARINLGLGLIVSGNQQSGIAQLEKAKELNPKSEDPDIKIILAYLNTNSLDKALDAALSFTKEHPKSIAAYTLLGTVYMAKGDPKNAGKIFEEGLTVDPGNVTANSGLAAIALHSGEFDKAKQYYNNALEKHPGDLGTLINLAKVENAQKNPDAMKATLENAITSNPKALEPRLMLSQYYLQNNNAQKALSILVDLRVLAQNNTAYLALLGNAELSTGSFSNAKDDLINLDKLTPNNADVHFLLAQAYAGLKDEGNYRAQLNTTLELNKNHRHARIALVKLLLREKNTKDASAQMAILKKQSQSEDDILVLEADLARLSGNLTKALDYYQRAFIYQKNNFNLLLLEETHWSLGHHEAAVNLLQKWLENHPEDLLTELELASRYLSLGRKNDAIETYSSILKKSPTNIIALNNLAMLTLDSNPKQSTQYAEKAYSINSDSAMIMDTLAVVLSKSDSARSLKMIDRALIKSAGNTTYLYHKAMILRDAGNREGALKIVQALLKKGESFPEIEDARNMLIELGGHT
jgi:putative PEP-CTERM system TPR-repeat lipoprotein